MPVLASSCPCLFPGCCLLLYELPFQKFPRMASLALALARAALGGGGWRGVQVVPMLCLLAAATTQ